MNKFNKIIILLGILFVSTTAYAQYEEMTSTYLIKYESRDLPVRVGWGHEVAVGVHYWGLNTANAIAINYSPAISYICSYRFNNPFELGVGTSTLMLFNSPTRYVSEFNLRGYTNFFANMRLYLYAEKRWNAFFNLAAGLDISYYNIDNIEKYPDDVIYQSYKTSVAFYGDFGIGFNCRFNQNLSLTGTAGFNTIRLPNVTSSNDKDYFILRAMRIAPYLRIGFHF